MIVKLDNTNFAVASQLHIECISSGFISSLGLDFVQELYKSISEDKGSFGFISYGTDCSVLGFVAFSSNLSGLYKYVIKRKFIRFAPIIFLKMLKLSVLKKIISNLLYPSKMKKMELPDAELLSIVVASAGRGKGIAGDLVMAGFEECRKRGISRVKVLVAADNQSANKMYIKCGFELFTQIDSHGVLSNIYIAEI